MHAEKHVRVFNAQLNTNSSSLLIENRFEIYMKRVYNFLELLTFSSRHHQYGCFLKRSALQP